jgi:hypothetical protein
MKNKERIAQLEKKVEELENRIRELETFRIVGVGIDPYKYIQPSNPWTSPPNYPYPTITWQEWQDKQSPLNPLWGRTTSG